MGKRQGTLRMCSHCLFCTSDHKLLISSLSAYMSYTSNAALCPSHASVNHSSHQPCPHLHSLPSQVIGSAAYNPMLVMVGVPAIPCSLVLLEAADLEGRCVLLAPCYYVWLHIMTS